MKQKFAKFLSGIMLCLMIVFASSCTSDYADNQNYGNQNTEQTMKTSYVSLFAPIQTRANSIDTWSSEHSDNWMSNLNFGKPTEYTEVTNGVQLEGNGTYYVPATFTGTLSFKDNFNGKVYIDAELTGFSGNSLGNVNVYILENGSWTLNGINTGNITIYNQGNLILGSYAWQNQNIKTVYNGGYVKIGKSGENPGFADGVSLYSNGTGIVDIEGESIDLKLACDIHGTMNVKGNLKIQNGKTQYICGLEIEGTLDVTQGNLYTSYIKADEIKFDGAKIWLLPEAHIVADKISMPNSASAIVGYEGSHALVETGEFYLRNHNNFQDTFSDNISFKVNGSIDIQERLVRDNGQVDDVSTKYSTAADYLASQNGLALVERINASDISGNPECGESYGTQKPEEPTGPKLVQIGSIEAPGHDHDSDKTEGNRRLSATCIDFADGVFYVSYHMRGGWQSGEHYAGDTFDKDGVEGCIETWTLQEDADMGTTNIVLGTYMWTNNFDFNHLIIDGDYIVTVGHYDNKGAIIGKMPNVFDDFNAKPDNGDGYSTEFYFKYLTTAEKLYKDYVNKDNKEGNATNQFVDYKNAGDGNCVIKVGTEYWVATYEGYGKLDAGFNRIKDEADNVAFVSTDGSAKHIIDKGDDVAVLYLNERPETTATAKSPVSIATIGKAYFPFSANVTPLCDNYVQPVDGKNVLAWDGTKIYACLGKGGLYVDDEIYNFGENGKEPVNGIAIDEEYVYLAAGSHLRVFKVGNLKEEVTHYTIPNMSANYIKLATINGEKYIAVAFGQAGIKVFRLCE